MNWAPLWTRRYEQKEEKKTMVEAHSFFLSSAASIDKSIRA